MAAVELSIMLKPKKRIRAKHMHVSEDTTNTLLNNFEEVAVKSDSFSPDQFKDF